MQKMIKSEKKEVHWVDMKQSEQDIQGSRGTTEQDNFGTSVIAITLLAPG